MIPRAEGTKIRLSLNVEMDPESYIFALQEWIDADRALDANIGDLSSLELQPFRERVIAAEGDVEEAFSEVLDIPHAEMVLRMLQKAITDARVERGDYVYRDRAGW